MAKRPGRSGRSAGSACCAANAPLAQLRALADAGQGRIRILIAGKPSPAEFPDFAAQAAHPQIDFVGAYRPEELGALYARCHFAWAIDYFEEGLNSTWLLPNRLYEAAAFGVVPIALEGVETARWLAAHGAGLVLPAAEASATLEARLLGLDAPGYAALQGQVAAIPPGDLIAGPADCALLLDALRRMSDALLIVIPCLNEERHLPGLLAQLLGDSPQADIVVADGGSSDTSRAIVTALAARHPRLALDGQPRAAAIRGSQPRGGALRRGASLAAADRCALRLSARLCGRAARGGAARTDATSVVVAMVSKGTTCFQRASAAAQNSVIGTGGSPHRHLGAGRMVDHGHHALMDIALFRQVGGYREDMSHNEDAELDLRLAAAGGRIWLEPGQAIVYYPRAAPGALWRQYAGYGRGRARTLRLHGRRPKLRQLLPLAALGAMVLALGAPLVLPLGWLLALPLLAWTGLCLLAGVYVGRRSGGGCAMLSGVAAMIMHLAWSTGFVRGMLAYGSGLKP